MTKEQKVQQLIKIAFEHVKERMISVEDKAALYDALCAIVDSNYSPMELELDYVPYSNGYRIKGYCPRCKTHVAAKYYCNVTESEAKRYFMQENEINYCPHCGIQLVKETK